MVHVKEPLTLRDESSATPAPAPPQPPSIRPAARRRRWPRRLIRALLGVLVVACGALALTELLTPSVVDASARVAALDASHHTHPVSVVATDRIALATVAAEDERFYSHHGIDTLGALRGLWGRVTGVDLGGSTLDQQLAKNLYTVNDSGFSGSVIDAALALKLEGHYTKAAILSMYVDVVYYGHGYYGIAAASMGYFGVPVDRLTWAQAAMLAGLPQAPSLLDPFRNPTMAKQRQDYVLSRLAATGVLSETAADAADAAPLTLRPVP